MKFQGTLIISLFAQNVLCTGTFGESNSKLKTFRLVTARKRFSKVDFDPIDKDSPENGSPGANTKSNENSWSSSLRSNVISKESHEESHFSESEHYIKKHSSLRVSKRSVSLSIQQSEKDQETNVSLPRVPTSYAVNDVDKFTLSRLNVPFEQTTTTNFDKDISNYSVPPVDNNETNVLTRSSHENVTISSVSNTKSRWFIIDLTNRTSNITVFHIKGNSSEDFSVNLQENITDVDLCHQLHGDDSCMLSSTVTDLRNIFHVLDTNVMNTNGTNSNIPNIASNDVGKFSDEKLHNLTQNFNCVVDEIDALNISCTNVVNFYSVGEYLPNYTIILDLSYSNQIKLLTPLFPHLKDLKSLTLSNNHHRYITRAFMGLESLEILDLSNNDIMALLKAFLYVPKVKVLNLSGNEIRRVKVVSDAVSYLHNLQNLTLSHNYRINYVTKEDLYNLKNCNITEFVLFNTTINYIERGAFNFMSDLKVLEISVNYMNEYALANVTCGIAESIEIVFFRLLLNIRIFPYDAMHCLRNTKVNEIYLGNNFITILPVLPSLPNLRLFSLSNSSLEAIENDAFQNTPNIETISLSSNNIRYFPTALSSVKSVKRLYIDSQNVNSEYNPFTLKDYSFQHLINLDILRMSLLYIEKLSRYSLHGLRNLNAAFLSLAGVYEIENYAFETLTSLSILDLRGNGISSLSNFTFFGLKNLKHLYLSSNKILFFSTVYPFQYSPSLNVILLQNNMIRTIPREMFSNLKNLKILSLGKNKLIPWKERILHSDASLNILGLSQNNIDYISDIMLTEFHQVNNYLDLKKNPFNCSKCNMKEFQTFFQNSNLSFQLPLPETEDSTYICVNPESMQNKLFNDVELSRYPCQVIESEVFSLLTIVLMSFLLIATALITTLCYNFRWYIRYWIFHFKTSFLDKKNSFRGTNYTFDAFIIYSSVDTPWVEGHLIPALEEQEPRYKLCVHQRDFQVGKQITENIFEAIESSHKVILILTEGFIKSDWCMYELHLAQHKLFDDTRDTLILAKIKAIDKKLYTKNISYIEKTRNCYMWTDDLIGQKLFWEQIKKQLGPPKASQNFQTNISIIHTSV